MLTNDSRVRLARCIGIVLSFISIGGCAIVHNSDNSICSLKRTPFIYLFGTSIIRGRLMFLTDGVVIADDAAGGCALTLGATAGAKDRLITARKAGQDVDHAFTKPVYVEARGRLSLRHDFFRYHSWTYFLASDILIIKDRPAVRP